MKKHLSLLILFLITGSSAAIAQRQNVYFFKNDHSLVEKKDSADFVRVVREPDAGSVLYNVLEFYPSGNRKRIVKSSKIDPVLSLEGQCVEYYDNGRRKALGNYVHNEQAGEWFNFYPNGSLYTMVDYGVPDTIPQYQAGGHPEPLIKTYNDSTGKALVTDGNGRYMIYDDAFKTILEQGDVKNGLRTGEWKGKVEKSEIKFVEIYDAGKLIKGNATDDAGAYSYQTRLIYPRYKTGIEGFYRYLEKQMIYPDDERKEGTQGTVLLTFTVSRSSQIKDIKVVRSVSPALDKEAVRVIGKSKDWLPGYMFGRAVNASYTVPIKFSLAD